jgi:hypothetical protein
LAGCRTWKGDYKANLFGDAWLFCTSEGLILKKIDEGAIKVADVVALLLAPEVRRNFPQNFLPR